MNLLLSLSRAARGRIRFPARIFGDPPGIVYSPLTGKLNGRFSPLSLGRHFATVNVNHPEATSSLKRPDVTAVDVNLSDHPDAKLATPTVGEGECLRAHSIANAAAIVSQSVVRIQLPIGAYGDNKTCKFGTGFFIDEDGTILTCLDVVKNPVVVGYSNIPTGLEVILPCGKSIGGTVTWCNVNLSIALVKVKMENSPAVHFGSSTPIRAGEWLFAVGAPEGINNSITQGIVSCVSRSYSDLGITHSGEKEVGGLIQTDCVLCPGSEGSPLANLNGEVIGIVVMPHMLLTGISFAVPSNAISPLLFQPI